MYMEGSRRSFDRSREPEMKKPRLTNQLERVPNSSVRPFPQRLVTSGVNTPLASARLRTNDRGFETSDSGLIGYRPQQPGLYEELVTQYKTALAELTFNSKPIITNLTIIAGENLYAAKAIAATVCANILEVPCEQKLPSLYLLDSIVKNIGQDYIKHFAARLPEVFCKAYELVDPSVHPSMRHLFGTWKGVFPSQTLQMIEKELGFTPAANGSSSASSTLRSDLQSQHPPQSIHVNPKYLERQRLQSSRTEGVANDMTGVVANSTEDVERPNRALGAGQPWVDSAVNIHNVECSQRDAFGGSVTEKTIGTSYRGNEYGSDLSRNLSLGTGRTGGRVSELGHDKSWHEVGRGIAETISGQRNGFGIKHGFSNHEAPKSMTMDPHQRPAQSLASIRSSVMSTSWKNSEEEEYMWDDMNSGLTDHGASNVSSNLCKDSWRADDENLAVEDHLQVSHPFEAKVDREISTAPLSTEKKQAPASGHHTSLSWQLQEQHSIDEVNRQSGQLEGFASTLGSSISANSSIGRMGNRPFLPKAALGSLGMVGQQQIPSKSPSGQSTLIQQSLSHRVGSRLGPHQLQNSAEEDHLQTLKTSQFLGGPKSQSIQDSSPVLPSNVQVGNLRRSQQKDLQGSISSVTSYQPKNHNAISKLKQLGFSESEVSDKTEKLTPSETFLPGETSEQPTTSSLLAAVMKSGVFSNNSIATSLPNLSFMDHKILPSQSGVLPGLDGSSPTTSISSGLGVSSPTSLGPSPNNDLCTPHAISQEKVGQPARLPALPPASSTVSSASAQVYATNPISNLLSSLVAKGLISAKTESPTIVSAEALTQLQDQNQSIATSTSSLDSSDPGTAAGPVSSTGDEVYHTAKGCVALSQLVNKEIRNLIGFEFKPDVIRELHPPVINGLLDDFPHHCSNCGLRLKYQEQFDKHLDWHATREREQNDLMRPSRGWYINSSDWIAGKDEFKSKYMNTVDIGDKETDESEPAAMVPADENQCLCVLCGELFEDVYCQEKDKWMFKGAIYMTMSYSYGKMDIGKVSNAGGPIIHSECLQEISISSISKMEQD